MIRSGDPCYATINFVHVVVTKHPRQRERECEKEREKERERERIRARETGGRATDVDVPWRRIRGLDLSVTWSPVSRGGGEGGREGRRGRTTVRLVATNTSRTRAREIFRIFRTRVSSVEGSRVVGIAYRIFEGRRGPIVRHRVAARASREWPRGEKRKGSPRVAPPAAGGGKSLSLLRREQVSDPRDMPAGPPPPSLLPSSPLGRRFHGHHPPPGRHHRRTHRASYQGRRCHLARYHHRRRSFVSTFTRERQPIPAVLRGSRLPFSSATTFPPLPRRDRAHSSLNRFSHLGERATATCLRSTTASSLAASSSRHPETYHR